MIYTVYSEIFCDSVSCWYVKESNQNRIVYETRFGRLFVSGSSDPRYFAIFAKEFKDHSEAFEWLLSED